MGCGGSKKSPGGSLSLALWIYGRISHCYREAIRSSCVVREKESSETRDVSSLSYISRCMLSYLLIVFQSACIQNINNIYNDINTTSSSNYLIDGIVIGKV